MERTLVIDTATPACSVALIEGTAVIAHAHEAVARGHAERLLPMIAALPDGGRADRILVDCGPGSFTGVRVGIAAARALGLGWGVPVEGYSSTTLLAARAGGPVAVVLEGGHGEVFVQCFAADLTPTPLASLTPEAALAAIGDRPAVGTGGQRMAAVGLTVAESLPDAADAVLLPPHARGLPPRPIYGRAPDAKLPSPTLPVTA